MLSWRIRRQAITFLVIAVFAGGIAFFAVSRFLPAPSCLDQRRNQGETGVDCGGPCAPCELKNPKPVTVFWTRVSAGGPDTFDAVAFIENTNEILSSQQLQYEFTVFDEIGVIGRRSGATFIFPQERIYVIEPNITLVREPTRVEFKILGIQWELKPVQPPRFVVTESQYIVREADDLKQGAVEAFVSNTSPFDFREMETSIVVFDRERNILGVNRVVNEVIPAGARVKVISLWPSPLSGEVGTIEVKPRVNVLAPDAIIKPQ